MLPKPTKDPHLAHEKNGIKNRLFIIRFVLFIGRLVVELVCLRSVRSIGVYFVYFIFSFPFFPFSSFFLSLLFFILRLSPKEKKETKGKRRKRRKKGESTNRVQDSRCARPGMLYSTGGWWCSVFSSFIPSTTTNRL